jgi:hypothetical protein
MICVLQRLESYAIRIDFSKKELDEIALLLTFRPNALY